MLPVLSGHKFKIDGMGPEIGRLYRLTTDPHPVNLWPMGELLTSRRAVDLCRVGSCLCPDS